MSFIDNLYSVFAWAADEKNEKKYVATNPARNVERIKYASTGYHSQDEVEKFEQAHPIGTKARLALALLIYTGVRHIHRSAALRRGALRTPARTRWMALL